MFFLVTSKQPQQTSEMKVVGNSKIYPLNETRFDVTWTVSTIDFAELLKRFFSPLDLEARILHPGKEVMAETLDKHVN
jgi:hypothetical protein